MIVKCTACSASELTEREGTFDYSGVVTLEGVTFYVCTVCEEDYIAIPRVNELEKMIEQSSKEESVRFMFDGHNWIKLDEYSATES